MKAYHFTNDTLRDGSPIPPIGEWLVYDGEIELCSRGYHASKHPFDALRYAPGSTLHLVEVGGVVIEDDDKLVAERRRILASFDAEYLLREFARKCALDVVHLWDAPSVVREYLTTGDEALRAASRAAARDAAWAAAWDASRAAAWAAARAAARAAAWDAARDAARAAARDAALEAAQVKQRRRFERLVVDAFEAMKQEGKTDE